MHPSPPLPVRFRTVHGVIAPTLRGGARIRHDDRMEPLHEGQKIWVEQADGSQREGIFVGEAQGTWFGGNPGAYVVYPDTRSGEEVPMMRIVPRDDDEE